MMLFYTCTFRKYDGSISKSGSNKTRGTFILSCILRYYVKNVIVDS